MTSPRCGGCGRFRSRTAADSVSRPPCPNCSSTAVAHQTIAALSQATSVRLIATITPREQTHSWARRWQDILDTATGLLKPRTTTLSSPAIQAAVKEIREFYVLAYHLKDDLIIAAPTTGISRQAIESTITRTPDLALLCDLANLVKHGALSQPPRSGDRPRFISRNGRQLFAPEGSWRVNLVIEHNGLTIDGLDVVRRSVQTWTSVLDRWGLI
jgi:hypothetical protein